MIVRNSTSFRVCNFKIHLYPLYPCLDGQINPYQSHFAPQGSVGELQLAIATPEAPAELQACGLEPFRPIVQGYVRGYPSKYGLKDAKEYLH